MRLASSGGSAAAAEAFEAHRHSYIGESDLQDISSLGIKSMRLPVTWAVFADALKPIDSATYGAHDPEHDTVIVPDPLYPNTTAFATVPRAWLAQFLRRAKAHGLQVLLDLHAFPGGAADGTYNGVWPQKAGFWMNTSAIGDTNVRLTDAGLWIAKAAVDWLERLDEDARGGLLGVTFMNEPAHMAAVDGADRERAFLEREGDVLDWLEQTANYFRASTLPRHGKKLYVQVIATAFKNFTKTVVPWFNRAFTEEERQTWAVADQHWYSAWDPACSGRTSSGGAYHCDEPLDEVRKIMRECIEGFVDDFAAHFPGLKAVTEFSVGTYEDARFACNDKAVLEAFLEEQVAAMERHRIEPFFWTWRMPYGPVFEPGWSLKRLAGLEASVPEVCDASATSFSI